MRLILRWLVVVACVADAPDRCGREFAATKRFTIRNRAAPRARAPRRMRDACAVRYQHRNDPPAEKPIDQVAYVFLDEADARAHLHEPWLRELEVGLVDGAGKRRLDLAYQPVSVRLPWVENLDDR